MCLNIHNPHRSLTSPYKKSEYWGPFRAIYLVITRLPIDTGTAQEPSIYTSTMQIFTRTMASFIYLHHGWPLITTMLLKHQT